MIGTGGRIPPDTVIEDDASGSVETSGVFDPAQDGLDFYESLEGMRVQLNDAVAVGPTEPDFGETPVIGDDGANASVRTYRGGLLLRPDDGNPERVTLDDLLTPLPDVNVGDHYSGPITGVMDYNFGNPFIEVTSAGLTAIHDGVTRETTDPSRPGELTISTFNFENLAAGQTDKLNALAHLIVDNLRSPDLIAGEEVQDNNGTSGSSDDTVVDASQTLLQLVAAISAAGGPTYSWRQIDPVDDQDGGAPGGNIRQVFLFRTDRGLSFVDRPGGGLDDAERRRRFRRRDAPAVQPRPHRPRKRRVGVEPQAAGGRVRLPRPQAVRDREPLQLEGRRRPAARTLPAAGPGDGDAAAPAGARGG